MTPPTVPGPGPAAGVDELRGVARRVADSLAQLIHLVPDPGTEALSALWEARRVQPPAAGIAASDEHAAVTRLVTAAVGQAVAAVCAVRAAVHPATADYARIHATAVDVLDDDLRDALTARLVAAFTGQPVTVPLPEPPMTVDAALARLRELTGCDVTAESPRWELAYAIGQVAYLAPARPDAAGVLTEVGQIARALGITRADMPAQPFGAAPTKIGDR